MDQVDVEGVVKFVSNLQQPDGSFVGDQWGETVDTHTHKSYTLRVCMMGWTNMKLVLESSFSVGAFMNGREFWLSYQE